MKKNITNYYDFTFKWPLLEPKMFIVQSIGSTNQLTLLQFLLQWHTPFVYILPE